MAAWGHHHVWPFGLTKTLRKLFVAELWTFVWKQVEEPWTWLVVTVVGVGGGGGGSGGVENNTTLESSLSSSSSSSNNDDGEEQNKMTRSLSPWWQTASDKAMKILEKGRTKLIKALLRSHIEDFVVTMLSQGVTWVLRGQQESMR